MLSSLKGHNAGHVQRIKLIKRLQEERFLPLSVIKQMLERAEAAADDVGGLWCGR